MPLIIHIRKLIIIMLMCLAFALSGCGVPPAQEPDDAPPPAPAPVPTPVQEPEKEKAPAGSYRWEIADKRADKVPLNGKYLLDYPTSWGAPDDWAEQFWFEIFDDYILLSDALTDDDGIVEIDQFEGLTWICFVGSTDRSGDGPQNYYLYETGVFVREAYSSDLFSTISNAYNLTYKREDILLEERQWQEASESEKALLEFDPKALYLDKTFGEVSKAFPDLYYAWYEEGGAYFRSDKADKYFLIGAFWDGDEPPDDLQIYGYGARAKNMFPNMGAWVFKDEIMRVADTFYECYDYDRFYFTYQGHGFNCTYGESFDITPNTLVMVHKLQGEDG